MSKNGTFFGHFWPDSGTQFHCPGMGFWTFRGPKNDLKKWSFWKNPVAGGCRRGSINSLIKPVFARSGRSRRPVETPFLAIFGTPFLTPKSQKMSPLNAKLQTKIFQKWVKKWPKNAIFGIFKKRKKTHFFSKHVF